MRRHKNNFHCN